MLTEKPSQLHPAGKLPDFEASLQALCRCWVLVLTLEYLSLSLCLSLSLPARLGLCFPPPGGSAAAAARVPLSSSRTWGTGNKRCDRQKIPGFFSFFF